MITTRARYVSVLQVIVAAREGMIDGNAALRDATRRRGLSAHRHLDGHPRHHGRSGAGLAAEVLRVLLHVRDWAQRINKLGRGGASERASKDEAGRDKY